MIKVILINPLPYNTLIRYIYLRVLNQDKYNMGTRITTLFLILVLLQALHSVEEYLGKLWEVFPPARFLTGMISNKHETGFLIINIGLFLFGLWCWLFPVRKNYTSAAGFIWLWIIIEMINGIGHPLWSLIQLNYEPGLITAPFLLVISILLIRKIFAKSYQ